ncbi:uncharacterized protein LOC127576654 [Pristis pectinata]|uniref:uncharacterized protein LOC127576654 n=1 Tax=Pristis pectinata TaxID=685728 RepID=UPI00223CAA1B|nr:uncharacterized protein LOC127576654 [Pristis pectinata]
MSNYGGWRETGAAKVGNESFYRNRHLRWKELDHMKYPVVPDHLLLWTKDKDRPTFHPTRLSHVTTFYGARGIFSSGIFTSEKPKEIGDNVEGDFSWWSFEIDRGEIKRERQRYRDIIRRRGQSLGTLSHCFNSPAFLPGSRYGNFKFTYDIATLMEMYQRSVCEGQPPGVRLLGTFTYKLEVMHAVVVFPPGGSLFSECPDIPSDPRAVVSKSVRGWTWRPDSTGQTIGPTTIYFPTFRRWDHVGIAFHLPRGSPPFPVPPGDPALTYCRIGDRNISGSEPITKEEFDRLSEQLRCFWEAKVRAGNGESGAGLSQGPSCEPALPPPASQTPPTSTRKSSATSPCWNQSRGRFIHSH